MNKELIFSYFKKVQKPLRISMMIISGIAIAWSIPVMFHGTAGKSFIQYVAFLIIWGIEFTLLVIIPKIGIVSFPGASILFHLFVTNRDLRDAIGVINEYD